MALYSAGAVGVDIRPDTDNFWKILNAELHSRHPEVTVDVNTKGVARAKEQMRDLDGKTLTNVVKIDGDPSGLRAIDKAMQAQRKQWEKKPVTSRFDLDDTSFNEKIHRLSNQIKRTVGQTEAFVKKSQKSVADSLQDSLSRMRLERARRPRPHPAGRPCSSRTSTPPTTCTRRPSRTGANVRSS